MKTIFRGSVVYWAGEELDSSEPVIITSDDEFDTREEAEAWGREKANTPSPWEGRNFEDHFEVTEYEVTVEDGIEDDEEVRRWIYWGDRIDEVVTP